jgi:hypothetical protein
MADLVWETAEIHAVARKREITDPKTQLKEELHTLLNKRNITTKIASKNSKLSLSKP